MLFQQADVVREAVRFAESEVADVDIIAEGGHAAHVEREQVLQVNERRAAIGRYRYRGDDDTAANAVLVTTVSIFDQRRRRHVCWWFFVHCPYSIRLDTFFAAVFIFVPYAVLVWRDADDNEVERIWFLTNFLATSNQADAATFQADAVKTTAEGIHRRGEVGQQDITHLCREGGHHILCEARQDCKCIMRHKYFPLTLW